ncbi:hypothetical protein ACQEVG_18625 [Streptomyces sp. CA-135486]|uniref:hypothetical protein n=1 Tax=Streptomyces sp. CA-135486 TaxID=3240049 RepID=UPI003D905BEE
MIPAGRTPLGKADIAERLGKKSLPRTVADMLPEPISREGARTFIWDSKQIDAKLADREVPKLPEKESPKDLLDREEARQVLTKLGVELKPEAWRAYINHGYAPKPDKEVCGVAHWYRSTILQWPDQRPGEGAGAGRPEGTGKPLDPSAKRIVRKEERKERIRTMLKDADGKVTAKQIADAERITERQVQRLLSEIRAEAK